MTDTAVVRRRQLVRGAPSFVRRARQAVWVALGLVVLVMMRWADGRGARVR